MKVIAAVHLSTAVAGLTAVGISAFSPVAVPEKVVQTRLCDTKEDLKALAKKLNPLPFLGLIHSRDFPVLLPT